MVSKKQCLISSVTKHTNQIMCNTAFEAKFGDPNPVKYIQTRDSRGVELLTFLYWYTPAVIGAKKWKLKAMTENYSDLMTVSDEAYLYLMVEGNYNKWMYMKNRNVRAHMNQIEHNNFY